MLDPRWIRYAPFTLSGIVTVGVVVGFLANLANEAHFDPERSGPVRRVVHGLDTAPLPLAIAAVAAIVLDRRGGGVDRRLRAGLLGLPADAQPPRDACT